MGKIPAETIKGLSFPLAPSNIEVESFGIDSVAPEF